MWVEALLLIAAEVLLVTHQPVLEADQGHKGQQKRGPAEASGFDNILSITLLAFGGVPNFVMCLFVK